MKKILLSAVAVASLMSSVAFATPIQSGTPIQPGNAGCQLLSEAVTINLSSNVNGAYTCNVNNNTMRVATCHAGGSRKQGVVACAVVNIIPGVGNAPATNQWNDATCSDARAATAAAGGDAHTFTSSSLGKAFSASTAGGSVAPVNLAAVCTSSAQADAVLQ